MNSNEFNRSCKHLRKKYNYECTEDFMKELEDLFIRALGQPDEFSSELLDYCFPGCQTDDKYFDKLADMVDIFNLDYDETVDRLEEEDWTYLKDLVNSWALDMDMDVVTYVMQLVVSAGVFH